MDHKTLTFAISSIYKERIYSQHQEMPRGGDMKKYALYEVNHIKYPKRPKHNIKQIRKIFTTPPTAEKRQ